ncbi:hypothetical protein B0H10DRAFT_2183006 [Mycena sp. CBHHK59/15]|nr:hypothetical protein B0H10DRAFT_2183006 [Mycena sp. CBHHK59/15]
MNSTEYTSVPQEKVVLGSCQGDHDADLAKLNTQGVIPTRSHHRLIYVLGACFILALNYRPLRNTAPNGRSLADSTNAEVTPTSSVSLELPVAADLLFFLLRGPVFGHIDFVETANYSDRPIEVSITAQYHTADDLRRTSEVLMGVAQAALRHPHGDPGRDVRFNTTVTLPNGVHTFADLSTDLPMFSHHLNDLALGNLQLGVARLKTVNAPILRKPFFLLRGLKDLIGIITEFGWYLGVHADDSRVGGLVNQDLRWASSHDYEHPNATVKTSNAALRIEQIAQITNATFFLDVATSVGPATVRLRPGYEGAYDLRASHTTARLEANSAGTDPSWMGRSRIVNGTTAGAMTESGSAAGIRKDCHVHITESDPDGSILFNVGKNAKSSPKAASRKTTKGIPTLPKDRWPPLDFLLH